MAHSFPYCEVSFNYDYTAATQNSNHLRISIAAGKYDTEIIIDLINQASQHSEDLQAHHQTAKLILSMVRVFF